VEYAPKLNSRTAGRIKTASFAKSFRYAAFVIASFGQSVGYSENSANR
jgi:hypothetical protein